KKISESWPFVVRAVRCAYFFEFGLTKNKDYPIAIEQLKMSIVSLHERSKVYLRVYAISLSIHR
ncbi:hypothetical protein, partial [Lysinibacillus sp. FJAT-14745]|uniref:hypothetical protein n=1 Tax=Lysinibacillus sp. FJAT-14745 TaxID=1704289 RepID=UPI001F25CB60